MIELDIEKLKRLYLDENRDQKEIAAEFNVSVTTISRALKQYNIIKPTEQAFLLRKRPRPGRNIKISREELFAFYIEQNLSKEETAEKLGVSVTTIKRKLREYDLHKTQQQVIDQMKRDSRQKYGVEFSLQRKEVRDAIDKTTKRRTFEERERLANKYRETIKKNNTYWKGMTEEAREAIYSPEKLRAFILKYDIHTPMELSLQLNYSLSKATKKIHEFGCDDIITFFQSVPEKEIKNLLESWGIKGERTRKIITPHEIDFYNEEAKIGIEFNGSFWHGDIKKGRLYHLNKSLAAEEKGVFLYHIFEYEWDDPWKRRCIESQLRNLFGINQTRIFARKCELKKVSTNEKNEFLNQNHLQGADRCRLALGLYYKDELVALMTFCKPRFNKKYDWELSRFCCKNNYSVVGAASRLFAHFLQNTAGSIISYSDISKTRGGLYEKLGFQLKQRSAPGYVWCNAKLDIKSRYQTQMKNESQIMREKGYWRIYNCGNKVWVYER